MRHILKYSMLYVILLAAGCTDDENIMKGYPTADGDEIVFDAKAGYPTSRTIYDDYEPGSGAQGISWVNGDKISIYSSTSPNTTQVDYQVSINGTSTNTAVLQKINPEDIGLQWGGDLQKFYAVYPAKQQIKNEAVRNLVKFQNGVLTGYIPINQTHEITKDENGWKAKPIMEYSYMVAKQTVARENRENGVDLDFKPISSAIDITLKGDGANNVKINSINIISAGKQLTGQFTCDLNGWTDKITYPECIITEDDLTRNQITVDMRYGENNYIELGPNDQITFTVFLMPQYDIEDLVLRLSAFNMSSKELPLGKLGVEIVPHKKSMVSATLPVWGAGDNVNEWMKGLDDRTYVSQLSIPGTANSASYAYSGTEAEYYKTQTCSIEEQLNIGVRCFELRCTEGSGNDLSTAPLQCNRNNVGMTFGEVMDLFETFLKAHPSEFLMVMPSYESNSGMGGALPFMQRLNVYLKSNKNTPIITGRDSRYSVYGPDRTLGEVRGTIMIVARVTTEEYDETTLDKIKKEGIAAGVVIEKWGSLKDMWGRRGYALNGERVPDYAKGLQTNTMEYAMLTDNNSQNFKPSNLPQRTLEPDFNHATYRSDGTSSTTGAYVQDWARVVNGTKNYLIHTWKSGGTHYQYAYWQSSVKEKEDDIWNTFIKAVTDNQGKQGSKFYINCIDGYFVTDRDFTVSDGSKNVSAIPYVESYNSNGLSYTNGGIAGDIASFAAHFNDYFYNKLVDYGVYNITGSMNVVMLDRVLEGIAGENIVQMIVNNNYKFPLLIKESKE